MWFQILGYIPLTIFTNNIYKCYKLLRMSTYYFKEPTNIPSHLFISKKCQYYQNCLFQSKL